MAAATSYDAIVVGGGHNGLTCAAYLAKAGRRVLVLERRHVVGGAAVSEEIYPGFTYSVCSYVVSLLRPWIIRDLELARFGLEMIPLESSFLPLPDGRSMCRWSDSARTMDEVSQFSRHDAEMMPEFSHAMSKIGRFVRPIIDSPAPLPTSLKPAELVGLLKLGRHFQDANVDMMELRMKLLTMSAVDFLDEWFESEVLRRFSASGHRERRMCCFITIWVKSTGPSVPGGSPVEVRAASATRLQIRLDTSARKSAQRQASERFS